jgi:glycosyltransferase involved in cell wall biosynthesis
MKFLLLTQYFPPEIGGAQTRLRSTAVELKRLGHAVEVVTALPNYPRGKFYPGYEGRVYVREEFEGITVRRVWLYPAMGGGLRRMLNYASFTIMSLFGLLVSQRPDFIFVESPPLFLSIPACLAGFLWRVPFIFNVADLWPDIVVEGGFLKEGVLIRLMKRLEQWSYRRAGYVNAVTEGMRDTLIREKQVPADKVLFLPNGADTVHYQLRSPDAELKTRLGLEGKKIILWAGTLGHAHGLNYVLDAAKLLEHERDVYFLFIGDGSAKPELLVRRDQLSLRNVKFLDPVPIEQLPPYYSIALCGLASLLPIPLYDGARPSKIFPILASGKPVLFAGKGETARLIEEARAGIVVTPEDSHALVKAVMQLANQPETAAELGTNGRRFVEDNYQWSTLISRWSAGLKPALSHDNAAARTSEI